MRHSRGRLLLAALLLVAVVGCSFQGSISDADAGSSSRPRSATGTNASSSASAASPATSSVASSLASSVASAATSTAAPTTSGSSTGGSPAAPTTSSGTAGAARCHTADLAGSLQPGSPGAGQRYATMVLRNTSGGTCTVRGYGGIGLVDASGAPLPTHQNRVSPPAPATISLRPGGSASSQLHWSAVPGTGDATTGDCRPTPAALQVIPPDEASPLSIPWSQGPVCQGGTIDQQPYAAG